MCSYWKIPTIQVVTVNLSLIIFLLQEFYSLLMVRRLGNLVTVRFLSSLPYS